MTITFGKILKYLLFTTVLILSVTACQKEPVKPVRDAQNIVPVMQSVCTKAQDGQSSRPAYSIAPGRLISERVVASADGFDLVETVYENNTLPFGTDDCSPLLTKGSVVTTENLGSASIGGFGMDAYAEGPWHDNTIASGLGSADNPYPAGEFFKANVTKTAESKWTISGEPKWLNNVPLTFWSWKYAEPTRTDTHTATFGYTVKETVTEQEDLVYAFNNETRRFNDKGEIQDGKDEKVNIYFFHALSAVQFLKHENLTGYRISNIEIQNIDSHTECEMTSTDATPAEGRPNISFNHTSSGPATFSQAYDQEADDASLLPPASGTFKPADTKTFIMVPQAFGKEATEKDTKLKVTFIYTGDDATGEENTSPVFDFNGNWEAGKYYVYRIDLKGNIHVSISEVFEEGTKSDVKFQNTCNVNEYIRAAVVANWYDGDGNIVAAWDRGRDGSFTPGENWTPDNGFYYYTEPVAAGDFTSTLIDSFAKPTVVPVAGAHFEMTILVQAVASDGISSCFDAF